MTIRLRTRLAALLFTALPLAGVATVDAATTAPPKKASAPVRKAAAITDWTKTVAITPQGGFLLGNPNAKTKLIEYMSYSCPHCADFANEATPELKAGWIKRGLLNIEYRNFVRDPFDLSASLIARCGGQARFLVNHETIFSSFDDWIAKAGTYQPVTGQDRTAQLTDVAEKLGLIALAGKNGITPNAARACLADPKALETIMALRAGAMQSYPDFEGTPTFVLNGQELKGIHSWQGLKAKLPPLPGSAN